MNSDITTSYNLTEDDHPTIIPHPKESQVTIFQPGYMADDGRGFALRFGIVHIDDLKKAVRLLEEMRDGTYSKWSPYFNE